MILETARNNSPQFANVLMKRGFSVELAKSAEELIQRLSDRSPQVVVINAASLRSSGKRICRLVRAKNARLPLVVILPEGQEADGYMADMHLTLPLTARKLINRLKTLIDEGGGKVLQRGPIRLNLETNQVQSMGKSARLSPRLARLLQVLMENAGQIVRRDELFCTVWETPYAGDTRTLDVHIFWLRKAIEINPQEPRLLRTVRGEGYRLDV
ncbi:MAG: winged-helix domain-containing protein [Anaerolineales bacterium]